MKKLSAFVLLMSVSSLAYSDGSPWLPGHGSTRLGIDVTSGSTDRFFIGDESTGLGGDIEGTFIWLSATYGYDDIWAFDFRTGYADSQFETNPVAQEDVADTSFGVSYQFINEFELDNGLPTITGRLGFTVGGDYDPLRIDAIGDGASGVDLSLLIGKSVTPAIAVFADLTYRQRDEGVADGLKYLLSAYYTSPIPGLGFQIAAAGIRTDSDIDIGPDVGFDQFPQTNRDSDLIILGANYAFPNGIGLGVNLSSVQSGRNIPDTDIATFSLNYTF